MPSSDPMWSLPEWSLPEIPLRSSSEMDRIIMAAEEFIQSLNEHVALLSNLSGRASVVETLYQIASGQIESDSTGSPSEEEMNSLISMMSTLNEHWIKTASRLSLVTLALSATVDDDADRLALIQKRLVNIDLH